jgi:phosphatidyl-myo-inositol dimannoside synthase
MAPKVTIPRDIASIDGGELRPLAPSLLITPDFPPLGGGISNYLFNVYRQFDLRQTTLIAPRHPDADTFDAGQAYLTARFDALTSVPGLRGAWQILQMHNRAARYLRRNHGLVVHCGHVNAAIAARALKWRYGARYLVWTHALEIMDKRLQRAIVPALRAADLVVANSDFTRRFIEAAGVEPDRIAKIFPGADPVRFRPGLDCSELKRRHGLVDRPVLLTVARTVKANRYKGHDVVLRALSRVAREFPNVAYVVVGGGDDLAHLERLAQECGVHNNVIFAGDVSDAEIPLFYNACDVFVMCSREERSRRGLLVEGFGLSFLEASACGKPIVGGQSGGVPEAVRDGVTGLLVNPIDDEAVAHGIVKLLKEGKMAQHLGTNGRQWVKDEMNWRRAAEEFQQAVSRIFSQASEREKTLAQSTLVM